MTTPIIGTFNDVRGVEKAKAALREAGLNIKQFDALSGGEDVVRRIVDLGFSQGKAEDVGRVVREGKHLLVAHVSEQDAQRATDLLTRFESEFGRQSGTQAREAQRLQEVQEEFSVSKREVEQGGVRANTRVTETPVEKTVTLHEEHVDAHREPADRPLRPEEAQEAFREREVELTGKAEQARIHKEARVTGEVVLEKQSGQHEETIQDTVRGTKVDVEKTGSEPPPRSKR
jgi:stress response protein YsnF